MSDVKEITKYYNTILDDRARAYIGGAWADEFINENDAYAISWYFLHPEDSKQHIAEMHEYLSKQRINHAVVNDLRAMFFKYMDRKQDVLIQTGSVVYLVGSLSDGYIRNGDFDSIIITTNPDNPLSQERAWEWQEELLHDWPRQGNSFGTISVVPMQEFRQYCDMVTTGTENEIWDHSRRMNLVFEDMSAPLIGHIVTDPMNVHRVVCNELIQALDSLPIFAATVSANLDSALKIREERMRAY